MSVRLHEGQKQIARDRHRFKVVCCGRRWGKTTYAIQELLGRAGHHSGYRAAYIAPTYQQARDIAWDQLKSQAHSITKSVNESRLEITLKNDSSIILRGWEAIETLRGQAFDFIVIDEIAMMRRFQEQWQEVIRPTLTDRKGEVLFISTPKGYNHFHDLYQLQDTDKDYKSYHFTSYDNPFIPPEEIDKAKLELTEDSFAQEYLADFRKATGLAHKNWNRELHLIPSFEIPAHWQRARGFDYGSSDPTASVRVAISPDGTWFVERCYKDKQKTIQDHAVAIQAQDYGLGFIPNYGDPSGGQWFIEFAQHNLNIIPATKEQTGIKSWVEFCIEKVNQRLKPVPGHKLFLPDGTEIQNAPKLFVLDTDENKQLVQEIELLRWKETSEGVTMPVLDDHLDPTGHFDLCAALRYLTVSYQKQTDVIRPVSRGWAIE